MYGYGRFQQTFFSSFMYLFYLFAIKYKDIYLKAKVFPILEYLFDVYPANPVVRLEDFLDFVPIQT